MQILDLEATQVKNLTPIAKFNNLKLLILIDTQVHDLAPISGLSNLKCIDISNTEVNRLTGVEALQRRGVEVRNFGSEHPKRRN